MRRACIPRTRSCASCALSSDQSRKLRLARQPAGTIMITFPLRVRKLCRDVSLNASPTLAMRRVAGLAPRLARRYPASEFRSDRGSSKLQRKNRRRLRTPATGFNQERTPKCWNMSLGDGAQDATCRCAFAPETVVPDFSPTRVAVAESVDPRKRSISAIMTLPRGRAHRWTTIGGEMIDT